MRTLPIVETDPQVACTLGVAEQGDRVAAWRALTARATRRAAADGGLDLQFPSDPALAADLARLAAAEQACCAFFTFTLRVDRTGLTLEVRAPAAAAELVTTVFG